MTEVVIEMVKAGLGVSFLARWTLNGKIESNGIVALPLSRKGFFRCWSAIRLRTELSPPYLDYFIDLLARNTPDQGPEGRGEGQGPGVRGQGEIEE